MDRTELYNSSGLRVLQASYDENKLMHDTNMTYKKDAEMFGMKRGEYKPYSEYKKSKSNSN